MRFEPRAVVDRLADALAPPLAVAGFRRSRRAWARRTDNVSIVSLQTASWFSDREQRFTMNVGVWSRCVAEAEAEVEGGEVGRIGFSVWDCHLQERLGRLLPDRPPDDYWWIVDRRTDEALLQRNFLHYVEDVVVPFVERVHRDAGLRDHWLPLFERDRLGEPELGYLEALVARLGPRARLADIRRARAHERSEETIRERQAELVAAAASAVLAIDFGPPYGESAGSSSIRTPPG